MKEIDLAKESKYSLELIFSEADKLAEQVLKSISENANKSFVLFAIYSSIFSYSFVKISEHKFEFIFLLAGSTISIFILHRNLFPTYVKFRGALPQNILVDYFNNFQGEQLEKEYLATQIQSYNSAMLDNQRTIEKMVNRFLNSIFCMALSFLAYGLVFFFYSFIEGLNT